MPMKRRLKILSVFLSIFLVTGFFAGCDSAADLPDADMLVPRGYDQCQRADQL